MEDLGFFQSFTITNSATIGIHVYHFACVLAYIHRSGIVQSKCI